jgi:hypothetical protein
MCSSGLPRSTHTRVLYVTLKSEQPHLLCFIFTGHRRHLAHEKQMCENFEYRNVVTYEL